PNLLPRHAGLPPPVHRHPREGHGRLHSVLHRGLGNASRRKEGADAADRRRGGDAEEPRWRPAPRTELVRRGKSIRSSLCQRRGTRHLAFDVDNLDRAVADLVSKGVEVVIRPGEIGGSYGWREAFAKDPNGIWIELLQRK